ncbi:MAG: family 20 glycosylhydrolase [Bacteroidota bacterium]
MRFKQVYLVLYILATSSCSPPTTEQLPLLPTVASSVEQQSGRLNLRDGVSFEIKAPSLAPLPGIFEADFYLLTGINNIQSTPSVTITLDVDASMAGESNITEAYEIEIGEDVSVRGASYAGVSMGLVTLLQLMDTNATLPKIRIQDRPATPYRSLMIDLARSWHDVSTIKSLITLCKWYKINYLHLHLTDDQSFTFPSTAFPQLATEGRHYTLEELEELNAYAQERGVILVPELDVPGHATQLVSNMPSVFGIGDPRQNSYTITMGREATYAALNILIEELAAAFPHTPYIHIGGDEAFFAGMDEDPETQAYMQQHGIPNVDELFRHFLARLNDMVRAQGRQTLLWAGFTEAGEIEIPKDMVVMLWESQYYDPQRLIDAGYPVVNATFKPLYVVNNRKWDPAYIYTQWNLQRWESWTNTKDKFLGTEVQPTNRILGATMCAWEQNQINQLPRLRKRLPAMASHLWEGGAGTLSQFEGALTHTDAQLTRLLHPFGVNVKGRSYPALDEGNFYEHLQFDQALTLSATAIYPDLILRHTLDGTAVTSASSVWLDDLTFNETTTVKIQAFNAQDEAVGLPFHQRYFYSPITASAAGLWKQLPHGSWEKHRFEDSLTLSLHANLPDADLRYTLDGSAPNPTSPVYATPLTIKQSTSVRAQLIQRDGTPIGSGFSQTYFQIINDASLTTGKPAIASTDNIRPGLAELTNNGRITLWEHWEGHVGEDVWIEIDLEKPEQISRLKVYNYWDNYRYYQYTIDGSVDGSTWTQLVDFSQNTEKTTLAGYTHTIVPSEVRFLKLNLLFNSANPGLHVTEISAFHE